MTLGICDRFHPHWPKFEWIGAGAQGLGWTVMRMLDRADLEKLSPACDWILFSQRPPVAREDLESLSAVKRCPWVAWVFDLLGHGLGDGLLEEIPWHIFDVVLCKNPEALPMHPKVIWLDQGAPLWR